MFRLARAQRSVHYVVTSAGVGGGGLTIVADVAAAQGVQRIVYRRAGKSGRATIRVVRRTAYIRGDAFALHGFLGFTTAQSTRYAGRWLALSHTSAAYATVAAAVTLKSFLAQIYPQTHLSRVHGTLAGHRLEGVRGNASHEGVSFVETVYARAGRSRLPVEESETSAKVGFSSRTVIGPWNETVRVRAPNHALRLVGGPLAA
jgi:hypothetical protein